MESKSPRWEQRFSNYKKALAKFNEAVLNFRNDYILDESGSLSEDQFLDDILKEGFIQRFEYTHELAWKVMKDYLFKKGNIKTLGSKDATKEAFSAGLIENGNTWMEMIQSRNMTSHTYNKSTANEIFFKILNDYHPLLNAFVVTMENALDNDKPV